MQILSLIFLSTILSLEVSAAANIDFGTYHSLVIGINEYGKLPCLETAVNDASAVHDVLRKKHDFKSRLLLNLSRREMIRALEHYRATLTPRDNLLKGFSPWLR